MPHNPVYMVHGLITANVLLHKVPSEIFLSLDPPFAFVHIMFSCPVLGTTHARDVTCNSYIEFQCLMYRASGVHLSTAAYRKLIYSRSA